MSTLELDSTNAASAAAAARLAGRIKFALLLLLVAGTAGCSSEDSFVDVGGRRNRDGGSGDGAVDGDGAVGGGSGNGSGGSGADDGGSGTHGDGGMDDEDGGSSEPEIDVSNCNVSDQDDFEIAVPFVEGGFAIAPGPVDFGMAYIREAVCPHAVDTIMVDSSGAALSPVTVLQGCNNVRELTLASAADGWHMAWTDNSSGAIDLHTALLDSTLQLPSAEDRTPVTSSPMEFEIRPVIAGVAGGALIAWYGEGVDTRRILTKRAGASGEPVEVVPDSAGHEPIELALAQLGETNAAIAWVEEAANRGIWLQALDSNGEAVGTPRRMTDYAAPGSTVDLVTRADEGGAAAYSVGVDQVNFDVRFRRLTADASFRGEEVKIIARPLQAKDAGIARLGGGYVIAYRAIPDGTVIRDPQIRLVFLSKEGNLDRDAQGRVVTFPVTGAARDGSRVQVEVSVDGQLLIAFVDGSDQEENVLRVLRRRLDCGL